MQMCVWCRIEYNKQSCCCCHHKREGDRKKKKYEEEEVHGNDFMSIFMYTYYYYHDIGIIYMNISSSNSATMIHGCLCAQWGKCMSTYTYM